MDINGKINIYIQGLGSGSRLWASAPLMTYNFGVGALPYKECGEEEGGVQRDFKRARILRYVHKHDYVDPCWASASCITAFLRRSGTKLSKYIT